MARAGEPLGKPRGRGEDFGDTWVQKLINLEIRGCRVLFPDRFPLEGIEIMSRANELHFKTLEPTS
jgi:hypothetical protein